ncbi:MAG: Hsp20/alpha crystallin family protein [Armatimonadota bacterium]|nr:Hsp20/alpha crystallin family protein [Armatimonadota bacterium]MDR7550414.1 Hsp20/alpha crystallin family protein [Armatimonadota bacterium]
MRLVPVRPVIYPWNPWKEMEDLRRDVKRWIEREVTPRWLRRAEASVVVPDADLFDAGDHLEARIDLPGVSQEDIQITLEGTVLTVTGQRKAEDVAEERYLCRERPVGRFAVTFDLPVEVDGDKVRATFRQGVLAITLPKSPAVMPKRVTVSVQ